MNIKTALLGTTLFSAAYSFTTLAQGHLVPTQTTVNYASMPKDPYFNEQESEAAQKQRRQKEQYEKLKRKVRKALREFASDTATFQKLHNYNLTLLSMADKDLSDYDFKTDIAEFEALIADMRKLKSTTKP